MLTKTIRPGQLFTANKMIFKCYKQTAKEYVNEFVCSTCQRENCQECLAEEYNFDCCHLKGGYPKPI